MKKLVFSLLLIIGSLATTFAQTNKTQVTTDLSNTMADFISDLNFIMEDNENLDEKLDNTAGSFGSPEYFIHNGKQMESFRQWLHDYCVTEMGGKPVMHALEIQQNTITKVKMGDMQDQRYTFQAVLKRETLHERMPDIMTTWVVVWNGENEFVSILEFNDNVNIPVPVSLGEVDTNHDEFYIQITKVRKMGTQAIIELILENRGAEDVEIDMSFGGAGFVAYDDKGNEYNDFRISIGNMSWMEYGYGFSRAKRKLLVGVPVKARIQITGLKREATYITRMDWFLRCENWGFRNYESVKFKNMTLTGKPITIDARTYMQKKTLQTVNTGIADFQVAITGISCVNSQVMIDMLLMNTGNKDVQMDMSYGGAGFVAYDDKGNEYQNIRTAIATDTWMEYGYGFSKAKRKLWVGVPVKARICINNVKPEAWSIKRLDWYFRCEEWGFHQKESVKFKDINW